MRARLAPGLLSLALAACASRDAAPEHAAPTFPTPEAAVRQLVVAAEDEHAADLLLGPGGFALLRSGDDVADRQDLEAVGELIRQRIAFQYLDGDCALALLGDEGWELPIPLVREAGGWRFDVRAGREEVLNRRVGRNELSTLATLRELVEAQREYAAVGRDGNPPAYATRLVSGDGSHDGLYWPVAEGEEPSPLGPLVAEAFDEGYRTREDGGGAAPIPYHGYVYRLLTGQGAHAPGGARSYLDGDGRLSRGFAVLAWPATYGNSGVMTFQVNQLGIVFEKDLGDVTEQAARSIAAFDPDESWKPTSD